MFWKRFSNMPDILENGDEYTDWENTRHKREC